MSELQAKFRASSPLMSSLTPRPTKAGPGAKKGVGRGEARTPEPDAIARRGPNVRQAFGGRIPPILARETTAAALLDMKPAEFRSLVAAGALPRGREIAPGMVRWDTEQLRAVGRADAMDGDYEW